MTLPFQPAAAPAAPSAASPPFKKAVIVTSWNDAILSSVFGQNIKLLKFLAVAVAKGHEVIIAVTPPRHMTQAQYAASIRDCIDVIARHAQINLPVFRIEQKPRLREILAAEGINMPDLTFSHYLSDVEGDQSYIETVMFGHVHNDGTVEGIESISRILGFENEYRTEAAKKLPVGYKPFGLGLK